LRNSAPRSSGCTHAGFIDTDLARNVDAPKSSPEEIVRMTLNALERGEGEVLVDEITRQVHRGLSADLPTYFQSTTALRLRASLPATNADLSAPLLAFNSASRTPAIGSALLVNREKLRGTGRARRSLHCARVKFSASNTTCCVGDHSDN
jgi:hypothetical protein